MNSNSNNSQRRILNWILGIAAVLLLLSITGTLGVMWWMGNSKVQTDNGPTPTAPAAPTAAANWSPANFNTQTPDGVRQTSEKSWAVKGGRAFMNVRRKEDDSLDLRFVYPFDGELVPRETTDLVRIRWAANDVAKRAGTLNVTPEQIADLKAVSAVTDIPASGADKQRLRTLFEDFLATQHAANEKALVDAVIEIDKTYYEQTRERINGIADKVKAIFTPDQLAALSRRYGGRNK